MNRYVVPRILRDEGGENTYTPDVPAGVSWSGCWHEPTLTYLIATDAVLDGHTPLTEAELAQECVVRGIDLASVLTWSVNTAEAEPAPEA